MAPRLMYLADLRYRLRAKEGGNVHIRAMKQAFSVFAEVVEPACRGSLWALERAERWPSPLRQAGTLAALAWGVAEKVAAYRRLRPGLVYVRHEFSDIPCLWLLKRLGARVALEVNAMIVEERAFVGRRPLGWALRRRAELAAFEAADAIYCVSGHLGEQLVAAGVPRAKVFVTHNGIDPADFPTCAPGTANAHPVVGFVGTNHPWHRLPVVVEAFGLVAGDFPEAKLRIVGPGSPELAAAIAAAGLAERVEVTGYIPRSEALAACAGFDVAVVPTAAPYGSPLKLFEYMGLARAIVAAHTPAIAEVLTDGETGLLAPPDDAAALAGAMRAFLADQALRERAGRAAWEHVHAHFTWPLNARAVLSHLAPEWLGESDRDESQAA